MPTVPLSCAPRGLVVCVELYDFCIETDMGDTIG